MADRVIVISGGSRGLGLELVRSLLDAGERVATFSRSGGAGLQAIASGSAGERFMHAPADAADSQSLLRFVRSVVERFGRIDGLVNNAAVARDGVLATMSDKDIREVIDVNLAGTLLLTRECVRLMLLNQPDGHGVAGRIVNITSIVGLRGYAGLSAYSATKAGLIGMTASLARELGPRAILVNAVAPGYMETEMAVELDERQRSQIIRRTPLGRLGKPGDVVGAVRFLLSPESAFVTGQVLTVDGGISC